MGHRWRPKSAESLPGPGAYNPYTRAPREPSPAFSLRGRPAAPKIEVGPGPADYHAGKFLAARSLLSPSRPTLTTLFPSTL